MKAIIIALLITFACSTKLSVVEEEQELMWNPQGLVQCLKEAAPYSKDVIEIINLIKAKDYVNAFAKALALVDAGSQLVKKCIQYIKGSAVELTVNWIALGNCLLVFGQAAGLGASLGAALATLNIPGIIAAVTGIINYFGGNVPAKCKKFW